jgi:hypothetical protein
LRKLFARQSVPVRRERVNIRSCRQNAAQRRDGWSVQQPPVDTVAAQSLTGKEALMFALIPTAFPARGAAP